MSTVSPRPGAFTDRNGIHVQAGDLIEYQFGARRGTLVEALQDGDAYVKFYDTNRIECVKWNHLYMVM